MASAPDPAMSVYLNSDLATVRDGELMPPPANIVANNIRPSDVSTIAGTITAAPYQQQRLLGAQRTRIFVCLFEDQHYSKVCSIPQEMMELNDLVRIVARKFKVDVDDNNARLFLVQDGIHEVDAVEDIQAGDLIALDLGQPAAAAAALPPLDDTSLDTGRTTVETHRVANVTTTPTPNNNKEAEEKLEENEAEDDEDDEKTNKSSKKKTTKKKKIKASQELASLFQADYRMIGGRTPRSSRSVARSLRPTPAKRFKEDDYQPPPRASKRQKTNMSDAASVVSRASSKKAPTKTKKTATKPFAAMVDLESSEEDEEDRCVSEDEDEEDEEDRYAVGKRFFVRDKTDGHGGFEYPAIVLEPETKLKANQRRIHWLGYEYGTIVSTSELLPYTLERVERHEKVVVPILKKAKQEGGCETADQDDDPPPEEYRVGELYYYSTKGVEYPVTLLRFCKAPNKVEIKYMDYRTKEKVHQSKLLRATPERETNYNIQKLLTKQLRLGKRQNKQTSKKRTKKEESSDDPGPARATTTKQNQHAEPEPSNTNDSAEEDSDEQTEKDVFFGPPTDTSNLPNDAESKSIGYGNFQRQADRDRIVYISFDNEQPQQIAEKFRVPVEKVLYDNQRKWKCLKAFSRLKVGTPIVLPQTWEGKGVHKIHSSAPPPFPSQIERQAHSNREEEEDDNEASDGDEQQTPKKILQKLKEKHRSPLAYADNDSDSSEVDIGDLLEDGGDSGNNRSVTSRASSDWTDEDAQVV